MAKRTRRKNGTYTKKMGRPRVTITPAMCERIKLMAAQGYTATAMAEELDVSYPVFLKWKSTEQKVINAINAGVDAIVDLIEVTQFNQALPHDERTVRTNLKGKQYEEIRFGVVNQRAAELVLKTRKAKYRENLDITSGGAPLAPQIVVFAKPDDKQ